MFQNNIFLWILTIYLIGAMIAFVATALLHRYKVILCYHEDDLLFSIVLWPAWLVVFMLVYCGYCFKNTLINFWLWMANKHE